MTIIKTYKEALFRMQQVMAFLEDRHEATQHEPEKKYENLKILQINEYLMKAQYHFSDLTRGERDCLACKGQGTVHTGCTVLLGNLTT